MTAIVVDTLERVATYLAALLPECDVRRAYIRMQDPSEFADRTKPLVSVYVHDRDIKDQSRDATEWVVSIGIDVEKKVKGRGGDGAILAFEVDPLMELVERIFDTIASAKGSLIDDGTPSVRLTNPKHGANLPIYHIPLLEENHFASFMSVEAIVEKLK